MKVSVKRTVAQRVAPLAAGLGGVIAVSGAVATALPASAAVNPRSIALMEGLLHVALGVLMSLG